MAQVDMLGGFYAIACLTKSFAEVQAAEVTKV
jgi:hypothetical protein